MTSAFFDKAIPKSNAPERTEEQTSWRDKDARLDRRELARNRAREREHERAVREREAEVARAAIATALEEE